MFIIYGAGKDLIYVEKFAEQFYTQHINYTLQVNAMCKKFMLQITGLI